MNMLLQILEEGKLTDNVGRAVDFRNTIILLTSNVGADLVKKQSSIGFTPTTSEFEYERLREIILDETKKVFKPEFLNRLDEVVVFHTLTRENLIEILDLETDKVLERLKHRNVDLHLDSEAKVFLVEKGYDPTYGARPMRRAVEKHLEDPLAEEILKGVFNATEKIMVTVEGDKLVFKQEASKEGETISG